MDCSEFFEINFYFDLKVESVKDEFYTESLILNLKSLLKCLLENIDEKDKDTKIKEIISNLISKLWKWVFHYKFWL